MAFVKVEKAPIQKVSRSSKTTTRTTKAKDYTPKPLQAVGVVNNQQNPLPSTLSKQEQQEVDQLYNNAVNTNYQIRHGNYGYEETINAGNGFFKPYQTRDTGLTSLGNSMFDNAIIGADENNSEFVQNQRADNQPWFAQLLAGTAKFGWTATESLVGGAASILSILNPQTYLHGTGDKGSDSWIGETWHRIWDNDIQQGLDEIGQRVEQVLPNYKSVAAENGPFYEHMFDSNWANFWGDTIIKNVGYTVGMMVPGIGIGAAMKAMNLGSKLYRASRALGMGVRTAKAASTITKGFIASSLSAAGEAAMESQQNSNQWAEKAKQDRMSDYVQKHDQIVKQYGNSDTARQLIAKLDQDYSQSMQHIDEDRTKMGNTIFMANLGILTMSNWFQFGKLFTGGFNTGSKLTSAIRKATEKDIAKAAGNAATKAEGTEAAEELLAPSAKKSFLQKMKDKLTGNKGKAANTVEENAERATTKAATGEATTTGVGEAMTSAEATKAVDAATKEAASTALEKTKVGRYMDFSKYGLQKVTKALGNGLAEGMEEVNQQYAANIPGDYYNNDLLDYYQHQIDPRYNKKTSGWLNSIANAFAPTFGADSTWEQFFAGAFTGLFGAPGFKRNSEGKLRLTMHGGIKDAIEEVNAKKERNTSIVNTMNDIMDKNPKMHALMTGLIREQSYMEDANKAIDMGDKHSYENNKFRMLASAIEAYSNAGKLDDLKEMISQSVDDMSDEDVDKVIELTSKTLSDGTTINPFKDKNGNPTFDREGVREKLQERKKNFMDYIDKYEKYKDDLEGRRDEIYSDEAASAIISGKMIKDNFKDRISEVAPGFNSTILDILDNAESSQEILDLNPVMEEPEAPVRPLEPVKPDDVVEPTEPEVVQKPTYPQNAKKGSDALNEYKEKLAAYKKYVEDKKKYDVDKANYDKNTTAAQDKYQQEVEEYKRQLVEYNTKQADYEQQKASWDETQEVNIPQYIKENRPEMSKKLKAALKEDPKAKKESTQKMLTEYQKEIQDFSKIVENLSNYNILTRAANPNSAGFRESAKRVRAFSQKVQGLNSQDEKTKEKAQELVLDLLYKESNDPYINSLARDIQTVLLSKDYSGIRSYLSNKSEGITLLDEEGNPKLYDPSKVASVKDDFNTMLDLFKMVGGANMYQQQIDLYREHPELIERQIAAMKAAAVKDQDDLDSKEGEEAINSAETPEEAAAAAEETTSNNPTAGANAAGRVVKNPSQVLEDEAIIKEAQTHVDSVAQEHNTMQGGEVFSDDDKNYVKNLIQLQVKKGDTRIKFSTSYYNFSEMAKTEPERAIRLEYLYQAAMSAANSTKAFKAYYSGAITTIDSKVEEAFNKLLSKTTGNEGTSVAPTVETKTPQEQLSDIIANYRNFLRVYKESNPEAVKYLQLLLDDTAFLHEDINDISHEHSYVYNSESAYLEALNIIREQKFDGLDIDKLEQIVNFLIDQRGLRSAEGSLEANENQSKKDFESNITQIINGLDFYISFLSATKEAAEDMIKNNNHVATGIDNQIIFYNILDIYTNEEDKKALLKELKELREQFNKLGYNPSQKSRNSFGPSLLITQMGGIIKDLEEKYKNILFPITINGEVFRLQEIYTNFDANTTKEESQSEQFTETGEELQGDKFTEPDIIKDDNQNGTKPNRITQGLTEYYLPTFNYASEWETSVVGLEKDKNVQKDPVLRIKYQQLTSKKAFKYINEGNLKVGDTLTLRGKILKVGNSNFPVIEVYTINKKGEEQLISFLSKEKFDQLKGQLFDTATKQPKTITNPDGSTGIATLTTKVTQILNGRYVISDKPVRVMSLMGDVVYGISRGTQIHLSDESIRENLIPTVNGERYVDGKIIYYTKASDGRWYPHSISTKRFWKTEDFNVDLMWQDFNNHNLSHDSVEKNIIGTIQWMISSIVENADTAITDNSNYYNALCGCLALNTSNKRSQIYINKGDDGSVYVSLIDTAGTRTNIKILNNKGELVQESKDAAGIELLKAIQKKLTPAYNINIKTLQETPQEYADILYTRVGSYYPVGSGFIAQDIDGTSGKTTGGETAASIGKNPYTEPGITYTTVNVNGASYRISDKGDVYRNGTKVENKELIAKIKYIKFAKDKFGKQSTSDVTVTAFDSAANTDLEFNMYRGFLIMYNKQDNTVRALNVESAIFTDKKGAEVLRDQFKSKDKIIEANNIALQAVKDSQKRVKAHTGHTYWITNEQGVTQWYERIHSYNDNLSPYDLIVTVDQKSTPTEVIFNVSRKQANKAPVITDPYTIEAVTNYMDQAFPNRKKNELYLPKFTQVNGSWKVENDISKPTFQLDSFKESFDEQSGNVKVSVTISFTDQDGTVKQQEIAIPYDKSVKDRDSFNPLDSRTSAFASGTAEDTIFREVMSNKVPAFTKQYSDIMSEAAFTASIKRAQEIKQDLEAKGYELYPDEYTLFGDIVKDNNNVARVAGTTDLLAFNKETGSLVILDFKTYDTKHDFFTKQTINGTEQLVLSEDYTGIRNNKQMSYQTYYTNQLNRYKQLLSLLGAKQVTMKLIPIPLNRSDVTNTVISIGVNAARYIDIQDTNAPKKTNLHITQSAEPAAATKTPEPITPTPVTKTPTPQSKSLVKEKLSDQDIKDYKEKMDSIISQTINEDNVKATKAWFEHKKSTLGQRSINEIQRLIHNLEQAVKLDKQIREDKSAKAAIELQQILAAISNYTSGAHSRYEMALQNGEKEDIGYFDVADPITEGGPGIFVGKLTWDGIGDFEKELLKVKKFLYQLSGEQAEEDRQKQQKDQEFKDAIQQVKNAETINSLPISEEGPTVDKMFSSIQEGTLFVDIPQGVTKVLWQTKIGPNITFTFNGKTYRASVDRKTKKYRIRYDDRLYLTDEQEALLIDTFVPKDIRDTVANIDIDKEIEVTNLITENHGVYYIGNDKALEQVRQMLVKDLHSQKSSEEAPAVNNDESQNKSLPEKIQGTLIAENTTQDNKVNTVTINSTANAPIGVASVYATGVDKDTKEVLVYSHREELPFSISAVELQNIDTNVPEGVHKTAKDPNGLHPNWYSKENKSKPARVFVSVDTTAEQSLRYDNGNAVIKKLADNEILLRIFNSNGVAMSVTLQTTKNGNVFIVDPITATRKEVSISEAAKTYYYATLPEGRSNGNNKQIKDSDITSTDAGIVDSTTKEVAPISQGTSEEQKRAEEAAALERAKKATEQPATKSEQDTEGAQFTMPGMEDEEAEEDTTDKKPIPKQPLPDAVDLQNAQDRRNNRNELVKSIYDTISKIDNYSTLVSAIVDNNLLSQEQLDSALSLKSLGVLSVNTIDDMVKCG